MDNSYHQHVPTENFCDYGRKKKEEIDIDEHCSVHSEEYTLTSSFTYEEPLSTIAEEKSVDLWTKGSDMSMPDLEDLDSSCTMDSPRVEGKSYKNRLYEKFYSETRADECPVDSLDLTNHYTQYHGLKTSPTCDYAGHSHRSSSATLSTASLSRSSRSSLSAHPSTAKQPQIESMRNARWDPEITDTPDEEGRHLIGVKIQFFRSMEYGSILPMELPICAYADSPSSLNPGSDETKSEKTRRDKKQKKTKENKNNEAADIKEETKMKSKKVETDRPRRHTKCESLNSGPDADNMKHTAMKIHRRSIREKIKARMRSIDKTLSKVRAIESNREIDV
ncbi:unnamed protein product [Cylindrotheca closterium]|uniref:Uncharacterized protein n=1 Tax=Cylindrotheca closterium TaxID=2856 RepID=A0AAD2PUE8_9STRA|nr:unnamed protein product [Cylindrotheca closterium]